MLKVSGQQLALSPFYPRQPVTQGLNWCDPRRSHPFPFICGTWLLWERTSQWVQVGAMSSLLTLFTFWSSDALDPPRSLAPSPPHAPSPLSSRGSFLFLSGYSILHSCTFGSIVSFTLYHTHTHTHTRKRTAHAHTTHRSFLPFFFSIPSFLPCSSVFPFPCPWPPPPDAQCLRDVAASLTHLSSRCRSIRIKWGILFGYGSCRAFPLWYRRCLGWMLPFLSVL